MSVRNIIFLIIVLFVAVYVAGCATPGRGSSHCYTFSVVHESCTVAQATNVGCEVSSNTEYEWKARCVGYFNAYHTGQQRICFDSPLTSRGACKEGQFGSLPPGGNIP